MNSPSTPYKYFAFISYSRKDSKAAAWLQKRLEWFRFPVKLVPEEQRPPHHAYIRPIYRDKTNLELSDEYRCTNIRQALEESRYLIVLCSMQSAVSKHVDIEVTHFIETHGGDASRILPIIVSGKVITSGSDTALCPALRTLGDKITHRNLPSMAADDFTSEQDAWEHAFAGIVSYLLHLDMASIRDHVHREKDRQDRIRRRLLMAFGMLLLWTLVGAAGWLVALQGHAVQTTSTLFSVIAVGAVIFLMPWAYYSARHRYERRALGDTASGKTRATIKPIRRSIFISYRRDDSSGYSGWIAEGLIKKFGRTCVFIDVDSIAPGESFPHRLDHALSQSAVVLVVIGSKWIADPRLGDPKDFVHQEVFSALDADITVIPLLVNGASMPAGESLPESLRKLAEKQAHFMRPQSWPTDMAALVKVIKPILPKPFWKVYWH